MLALTSQLMLSLCLVSGNSGGHSIPCKTTAVKLLKADKKLNKIYIFSSDNEIEKQLKNDYENIFYYYPEKLRYPIKFSFIAFFQFLIALIIYFIKSFFKLIKIAPKKIISFGGINSIPICIASKLLRIPIELHELNVVPGKAIIFCSKFVDEIHIYFSSTAKFFPKHKVILNEYPLRFDLKDKIFNKNELLKKYNLSAQKKIILILGGSQGSELLNKAIKNLFSMDENLKHTVQVIHQTGFNDFDYYSSWYKENSIKNYTFAFASEIQDFYNLADLIISRAGAGTIFEALFFNKRTILVPLEIKGTSNHQVDNAKSITAQYPQLFFELKVADINAKKLFEFLN